MRLRDLFRGPSNSERKGTISLSNSSLIPVLDVNTFVNAAQDKDTETLHKYLLAGFPPDQPDPSTKLTALHVAVESANIRAVQMLLQAGAQINVTDSSQSTPLHIASYMGYEEIVQLLLSNGADMYKQDNTGRNSFHLAVSTGNLRLIQHFLSQNDTEQNIIHIPDVQNWTPLMCACASNQPIICAFLLSHHADICARNDRGMTVFHLVSFLGSLTILKELLKSSSSNDEILHKALNQSDDKNQTPLFYACIEGHLDIAITLLQSGANPYHLDNDNQTCLHAMLSSSIILKRHIRLFYKFIQFVDYRYHKDSLDRTLFDLAHSTKSKTLIFLLSLLNYQTNSPKQPQQILSLRHTCIIYFKRSINYQKASFKSQQDLLENALKQVFKINNEQDNNKENSSLIEYSIGKSLDDISLLQQTQQQHTNKYQKNVKTTKLYDKKLRKTALIFSPTSKWSSQIDLQHTNSTWTTLTNKLKGQRFIPITISTQQIHEEDQQYTSTVHPMKHLVINLLKSPNKLDDLIDFPSLINDNNHLLNEDLKTAMVSCNLLETDVTN